MIRRVMDFVLIMLFVWASMLFGLWIIDTLVVPLRIPLPENSLGDLLTATAKVLISAVLVLIWLWLWREIVRRTFWRLVGKSR
ncbi:hypothetical protein DRO55_05665 [Candidatus Bathyarchaeota archaeon]|nr:MAG: hypothetical protein DRO55_05665 [Candidatus Bathyarchaeota archaeon]